MKFIITIAALLITNTIQAQNQPQPVNICTSVSQEERYQKAVATVATAYDMTKDQLCTSERFLAVEVQPHRVIERDGTIIPHVNVQLHGYSSSCSHMVRDSDQSITSGHCYSGE